MTGHVTLAHAGSEGSQTVLRLDGVGHFRHRCGSGGSFALTQVERGDHTLTLQVTDDRGEVTCQGAAVTFSIRQRSVIGGAGTAPMAPTVPAAPQGAGSGCPSLAPPRFEVRRAG